MADALLSSLKAIQSKIVNLEYKLENEKKTNALLRKENEELRSVIRDKDKELEKAKTDAEFLIYSYRLASGPDTIVETRREIAGLIRNIDRCIEMLKE